MQARGRVAPYLIVIDDEAGIREFVGRVAEQAGFVVEMAATGRDLILMLSKIVPAVIVLDLNMADTDGIEVLRDLAGRHLPTKIIIFSGSDIRVLESSRDIAQQQGLLVHAVLQKPIRKAELLAVLRELYLENEPFSSATLRSHLNERSLMLHYQPKISLATHEVIGCEALLRCNDSAGRSVSPEFVIAVAEDDSMIDELSIWIFQEAVAQRRGWSDQGIDLEVAINLSARSSNNPALPSIFASICANSNVPPEMVTLELTEAAAMDDDLVSKEMLVRLRLKGFKLSVDDFGTGYSSLLRLKQLPFTEIKVDKSFVMGLDRSRDDAAIMKAIIQLANSLDLHSVIEGAESQHALDYAASLGCSEAQGYFVSRPIPATEMGTFLKTWQWRKNTALGKPDTEDPSLPNETYNQGS